MNKELINIEDIRRIGQLGVNCDKEKIKYAIEQAQNHDVKTLLCDFWFVVIENWENPDYSTLVNGGFYTTSEGIKREIKGLKEVLAYFAYARYTMLNEYNDTPVGNVDFIDGFHASKHPNSIKTLYDYYRNLASNLYSEIETYLCFSKEQFPHFHSPNCVPCGDTKENCNKNNPLPFGFRGQSITKNDNPHDRDKHNFRY